MENKLQINYSEYEKLVERVKKTREKYGYLAALTPDQLNKLKEKIEDYKSFKSFEYKSSISIPEEMKNIHEKLGRYNINPNNITSSHIANIIKVIIKEEVENLNSILRDMQKAINFDEILNIDEIKNRVNNKIILNNEYLDKIKNSENEEVIKELKEIITKYKDTKILLNRNSLKTEIVHIQKTLIYDLENKINSLCYKLNIDYNNKFIAQKYYDIKNILNIKLNELKELLNNISSIYLTLSTIEKDFSNNMENHGIKINLTFDDLKDLSTKNIDSLIEDIKNETLIHHVTQEVEEKNRRNKL